MNNLKYKLIALFLLIVCSSMSAQNVREALHNSRQLVEGKKNLERDNKELKDFKIKIEAFNKAFDSRNAELANRLKTEMLSDMIREVKQSEVKAKQARIEIAQSSAEIRSDRREIRDNREDSDRGRFDGRDDQRDMARDQINKRDDLRDRRDDIRDFEAQISRAERQAKILKSITQVNFSFDASQLEKALANKTLIKNFEHTLVEDIQATQRELVEDNRERIEDRRERQDDRNERNEYESRHNRRRW
ncbi:hypothetical protein M0D21_04285 [Aquimarina sp. D1M17]|uniref:hypothetical protein n=1 Tax=Aquimarina acroporae TaxID=2937283 RepID=UPI0020C18A30|nr:hypothetical protein [Aquimarina acroporae]MCK8520767.1 hypothetical protein [Aquimarina acroporae]